VAIVEENGQIIAVRLYAGDEEDEKNDEEGFVTRFDPGEKVPDEEER
jgi:hypothetical protein